MLFAIEGIDGCGKSTVVAGLKKVLGDGGRYVFLSDPGSTRFGSGLRSLLKDGDVPMCGNAQLLAFTAARSQMVEEKVLPALQSGSHVICDRYVLSTFAYQGVEPRTLLDLNERFCYGVLPDLNVVIRVPVGEAASRTSSRTGSDRFDRDSESMRRVLSRYESQWCPMFGRVAYVDGTKDRDSVLNDVLGAIVDAVEGRGPGRAPGAPQDARRRPS